MISLGIGKKLLSYSMLIRSSHGLLFTCTALCYSGISYDPVSICPSVCHMLVLYQQQQRYSILVAKG